MSKNQQQAVSPVLSTELALLTKDDVLAIIKARYHVPGGTKMSVLRDLFSKGYKVKHVHKMLTTSGDELFNIRYQMVNNYFTNWSKEKK